MVEIAGMCRLLSPLIVEIRQFKNQKLSQTTKICLIVSENKLYAIKKRKANTFRLINKLFNELLIWRWNEFN